ncbi:MAG: hypothetical protein JWO36_6447 [Myxococcales bacterium]|nr:hypothetical protein [Myxococcales bacterium]
MKRLTLALVLAACGGSGNQNPPATVAKPKDTLPKEGAVPAKPADDPTCPILVPGTSISVEDAPNGAAFVFVTTGNVADVRKRATALAAMHDKHDGPAEAMGMMIASKARAAASDVPNGARVTFTAAKPEDAASVRDELRMHAHHLTGGTCKMGM